MNRIEGGGVEEARAVAIKRKARCMIVTQVTEVVGVVESWSRGQSSLFPLPSSLSQI